VAGEAKKVFGGVGTSAKVGEDQKKLGNSGSKKPGVVEGGAGAKPSDDAKGWKIGGRVKEDSALDFM
jgi:hypothetical protein